jgi:AcrR family transcriptional regulator
VTISPVSLVVLRGWPSASIAKAAVQGLTGQVLLLPPELPRAERDEIAELLALFAGLPVHVSARAAELPGGHVCLLMDPVDGEVRAVDMSIVLGVRSPSPGRRRLEASQELRMLRDAVVDCISMQYEGARLAWVAPWAISVSDSPSLALRFASAVVARHLSNGRAPD